MQAGQESDHAAIKGDAMGCQRGPGAQIRQELCESSTTVLTRPMASACWALYSRARNHISRARFCPAPGMSRQVAGFGQCKAIDLDAADVNDPNYPSGLPGVKSNFCMDRSGQADADRTQYDANLNMGCSGTAPCRTLLWPSLCDE